MSHPIRIAALSLAVLLGACDRSPQVLAPAEPDELRGGAIEANKIGPGVLEALQRGEEPSIMVALAAAAVPEVAALRRNVAAAQENVLRDVPAQAFHVRRRYAAVPALAAVVRSEAALRQIAAHPLVRRIDLDTGGSGTLGTSVPGIGADLRHDRDNDGSGVVVAVLDSGIDSDHADLAGALVHEACFLDDDGTIDGQGRCPDGSDRQTGAGAAADDAGHGTHVSGIVASRGTVSGAGAAPGASIVAIKVLAGPSFSGAFFFFSEIVAALDYIIDNNQDLGVQVINLSLGTNSLFEGECDDASAGAMAGADAVNTLRANGVITFASSGNNGSGTQMPLPACLSNVVSVGAVDNADDVAGFSNSNATTDIFAPGVNIASLAIGGGTTTRSGTSMASPHAAGCAALLIQAGDATTPDDIEARLKESDVQVTDPKNDLTFPRIVCSPDSNQPPTVTVDQAIVTVDEGSTALNSGTFSDPDGDAVALSASVGSVSDNGDGTWSWSFATTDGPDESATVTITATDALDASGEVGFQLVVDNVAPSVAAGPDATVTSGEIFAFAGTFSDPGVIDFPWGYEIDWGFGDPTTGSTSDQSAPILDSRQVCAAGEFDIVLTVTDKDGDAGSDTRTLTVSHLAVPIAIKPNEPPNPINLRSRGFLPVAILSTPDFDATAVDPATVRLGDEAGEDTPVAQHRDGRYRAKVEDVDGDGRPDLVLMFEIPALVANGDLTPSSTQLVLRGFLGDGCTNLRGVDSVVIVP